MQGVGNREYRDRGGLCGIPSLRQNGCVKSHEMVYGVFREILYRLAGWLFPGRIPAGRGEGGALDWEASDGIGVRILLSKTNFGEWQREDWERRQAEAPFYGRSAVL
jgi:hypothetical protein